MGGMGGMHAAPPRLFPAGHITKGLQPRRNERVVRERTGPVVAAVALWLFENALPTTNSLSLRPSTGGPPDVPVRNAARRRRRRFPSPFLTNGRLGGSGRGPFRSHRFGIPIRSSSS